MQIDIRPNLILSIALIVKSYGFVANRIADPGNNLAAPPPSNNLKILVLEKAVKTDHFALFSSEKRVSVKEIFHGKSGRASFPSSPPKKKF